MLEFNPCIYKTWTSFDFHSVVVGRPTNLERLLAQQDVPDDSV